VVGGGCGGCGRRCSFSVLSVIACTACPRLRLFRTSVCTSTFARTNSRYLVTAQGEGK
jgi:hypothetical protein